jgi:hypothetical protein
VCPQTQAVQSASSNGAPCVTRSLVSMSRPSVRAFLLSTTVEALVPVSVVGIEEGNKVAR